MERYICIHGHFHQPPRDNPWLEAIELQDSAYPCHDWNERITGECYGPNGASRIRTNGGPHLGGAFSGPGQETGLPDGLINGDELD